MCSLKYIDDKQEFFFFKQNERESLTLVKKGTTLGIISGEAINLSNSINPPFICSIRSSPPTKSAPAFFTSSNCSPRIINYES